MPCRRRSRSEFCCRAVVLLSPLLNPGPRSPHALERVTACSLHYRFVKVVCIDGKEWPKLEDVQKKYGALLRTYYVRWLDKLLLNDDPFVEGLTVREVILGSCTCSTIEEYKSEIGAPTMDARSWGGWAEIVLLAAKWKVSISLF